MMRSLSLAAVVLVLGCGGDEPAPTTQAPPPVSRPPRQASSSRPAIGPKPVTKPPVTTPELPLGLDPAREPLARVDRFALGDGYTLETTDAPPSGGETVAMVRPPAGYDASAYAMVRPSASPVTQPAPEGFQPDSRLGSDDGHPMVIVHVASGVRLRLVEGGTYTRGSEDDPTARPPHPVTVSPFYLSESEITVAQYAAYQQADGDAREPLNADAPDEPAVGLLWRDANGFCRWAGGRLPTEAEWELAARTAASFGNVWGNGRPLFRTDRQPGVVTAVMSEPEDRSRSGHFDLAGNAREWTADLFSDRTYAEAADGAPLVDPLAEPRRAGGRRVVRGQPDGFSVTHREGLAMSTRDPLVGFRLAVPISGQE